jgi:cellulose synthase/poly-beta-1,6-N-acetylglucosamine synthase-like glycosyltransferase
MAADDLGYRANTGTFATAPDVFSESSREAASGPTPSQYITAMALLVSLTVIAWVDRALALAIVHVLLLTAFTLAVIWRGLATAIARPPGRIARLDRGELPPYTVIVPLYHEAAMAPGIVAALAAIDYPKDRLQILIVLEADDEETHLALTRTKAAQPFEVVIAPPGAPKTKPRACNVALSMANGRYVVVYDAEDRPHRLQLQEAAARFEAGDQKLACLQAPLRVAAARNFLSRQFALEYAAQFEIILPALAQLGAPFPLGGTSNHFRTSTLKALGGWDAWNVTEDADLGFRLPAREWRTGGLRAPTWESAPMRLKDWLPQRTRWVKGFMQTWGVHMRTPLKGGWVRFVSLQATLGLAILSALAHGPVLAVIVIYGLVGLVWRGAPAPPLVDVVLLTGGWGGAILTMRAGARRAGLRMRLWDGLAAPLYWGLQSVAALFSIMQLCTRPYHWNKTRHRPPQGGRLGEQANDVGVDGKGVAGVRRAA